MKNEAVTEFLQSRLSARDFPSAVYLTAEKGKIIFQDALGYAVAEPEQIAAQLETIYDLASLTKPLITGLLCAKLLESGGLNLSDKVAQYFSAFDTDEKREITIENLLTHTAASSAWKPFYLMTDDESQITNVIAGIPLENSINSKVVYSDFNFLLLGAVLKYLYREPLDEIAKKEIFEPLDLQNTFFNPQESLQKRIAASEKGNEYEKQTCLDSGYDVSKYKWRDSQIWGEVHDGNCYFMKGVSGHAGLFSTAEETFKIAQQYLANETTLLKPETCQFFRTNFTPNLDEARSIAFQLAETKDSTASLALSKDSFGHLGFTGTSLWIEPETERIFILLTNRTHNRELPFININSTRRRFHELAAEFLDKNGK